MIAAFALFQFDCHVGYTTPSQHRKPNSGMPSTLFVTRLFDCVGSVGRRKSYYVAAMLLTLSGILAAFVSHYWLYVIVRVLNGAAACGVGAIGAVLREYTQTHNY